MTGNGPKSHRVPLEGLVMPNLPNVNWITDRFDHVFRAEITVFGHETIAITTGAWPGSEGWLAWRERMIKLANAVA